MRKLFLFVSFFALILAACGSPAPPSTPRATSTRAAQALAFPTPTGYCVDARGPTPAASQVSLFPAVSDKDHVRGQADAAVTVIMYSDFQCGDCAKIAAALEAVRLRNPAELRVVYRHAPQVTRYDKALLTLQASESAHAQGKFWELHDLLFSTQAEWNAMTPEALKPWLAAQVASLGLDTAKYETDLNGAAVKDAVTAAVQDGRQYGQVPLPLLLINGEIVKNPYILVNLESLIHLYALPARQFSTCPPFLIDPAKTYLATLETNQGKIVVKLFADAVPNTVNNFVFLAQNGWYDNIPFHQVVPGSLAQTGDPTGTGMGNPGYFIPDEILPTLKFDRAGMLAMFNVGPGTNGSQFFITLGPQPDLNRRYTIFGEVTSGLEVLSRLAPRSSMLDGNLAEPDMLITVRIEVK
jgi:cyclophilin family peptidyl-prolyl cis-trans isomerase/protein-disulfide isomerase